MSRSRSSSIEALESRIAPALLINGANLLGGSSPSVGESSAGGNNATVVKVISGQAIVWYLDGDVLGISVGPNASLEIHGDILGDIVANLTSAGRLSDSDGNPLNGEDGAILLPNNIVGLKTFPLSSEKGSVQNIITAGSVSGVNVQGDLSGIYAGDGAFDAVSHKLSNGQVVSDLVKAIAPDGHVIGIDFNPIASGLQTDFVFTKAAAQTIDPDHKLTGIQPGASVTNVSVGKAVELQIIAGSGNPNDLSNAKVTAGGSIRNITIESAFSHSGGLAANAHPSYELHAGNGSSGLTGGAGGTVDHITEKSATGKVVVTAGNGGAGSTGPGGAGGNISNYDAGSDSSQYSLAAGNGGQGIPGGAGGSLLGNNFSNRSPIGGIVLAGDFDNAGNGAANKAQDIAIINQGTGEIVIERNTNGDGTTFDQITQHDSTTIITALGDTPIGAYTDDVNGDGKLDIVVAYKSSNSLGIYLNQGGGVFWDATLNNGAGDYSSIVVGLTFSPAKIAETGSRIAVAETTIDGKGELHLLSPALDANGKLTYTADKGSNSLPKPVVDLVTVADGSVIVGTSDGGLRRATISGGLDGKPFAVTNPLQTLIGGLLDLDVDSSGTRLLALGATSHALAVFDFDGSTSTGALTLVSTLTGLPGKPLVAHFVSDGVANTPDQLAILEGLTTGANVDLYSATTVNTVTTYSLSKSIAETNTLKNFTPVYSKGNDAGFAAISSSLNQFTFSDGFVGGIDYSLPFASKIVEAHAGNGGLGIDATVSGKFKSGKGGAGGSISSFNAEANQMFLTAGDGGNAMTNTGGAGGSFNNPTPAPVAAAPVVTTNPDGTTTTTPAPATLVAKLILKTDQALSISAGTGGSSLASGASSIGGNGGSLTNLNIEIASGDLDLNGGDGGASFGKTAGNGGSITGITSLLHDGSLSATAGAGGKASLGATASGAGGQGGSITNFKHTLDLDPETESAENPYTVSFVAGRGGDSVSLAGGNGGSVSGLNLSLDKSDVTYDDATAHLTDSLKDSTLTTTVTAGDAGNGAKGGNGGGIAGIKLAMVLDQITAAGVVKAGPGVLLLKAGDGGTGSNGIGGNGGSIALSNPISGLTYLDPQALTAGPTQGLPLYVQAGNGANGSTKGGAGGDISGLVAQNNLFVDGSVLTNTLLNAAYVAAGHGGDGGLSDGGRGGNITNSLIGVQNGLFDVNGNPLASRAAFLDVFAGDGGNGGTTGNTTTAKLAKGGAGGTVSNGEFGLVSTNQTIGMQVIGGAGGSGYAAGGAGGALNGIKINSSQSTDAISAILVAGDGGLSKLATGVGGKGGGVTGVSQNKDVNSSINLIQAGNGGDNALGKGGAGGSVSSIKTVGFIGRPSDSNGPLGVIDTFMAGGTSHEIPQGIFSGRGGVGSSSTFDGVNGSVTGVSARQIAAIAAAMAADGTFAAASKVQGVSADLIGFDADRDGFFDDSLGGHASPGTVAPTDGFIFSQTVPTQVTGQRTGFVF